MVGKLASGVFLQIPVVIKILLSLNRFMDFRTHIIKLFGIFSLFILTTGCPQMQMPGESYSEEFKELNKEERTILQSLKKHIAFLAGTLGQLSKKSRKCRGLY